MELSIGHYITIFLFFHSFLLEKKVTVFREYSVTSNPLAYNGYRAKKRVQSARVFIENVSKPLHLASRPLHMAIGIGRTLSVFLAQFGCKSCFRTFFALHALYSFSDQVAEQTLLIHFLSPISKKERIVTTRWQTRVPCPKIILL